MPGETIGIIGPTGSGKSTLVNLVPRFYDAISGTLFVDGVDVTLLSQEKLRAEIAVVPQKALLFSGTIAENLRWGKPDATDEEIRRAAQIACADAFVQSFPDGYETNLGQGGVNLSGRAEATAFPCPRPFEKSANPHPRRLYQRPGRPPRRPLCSPCCGNSARA